MSWRAIVAFSSLAVIADVGCQFPYPADVPDDDAPVARLLGGTVEGMWTGAALTLRLESQGILEDLAAGAVEPFQFSSRLTDGASYLVTWPTTDRITTAP